MPKKKSIYTVREATAMAFEKMPPSFIGYELVSLSRAIMGRPGCMDGTILRRLRELRGEYPTKYGYRIKNNDKSIYEKAKQNEAIGILGAGN